VSQSVNKTLPLCWDNKYEDLEHLRANIAEFIEQYYNRQQRLHSALARLSIFCRIRATGRGPGRNPKRNDGVL
jgi:hypothetical protein